MISASTFNWDGSDPDHPPIYVGQDWNPLITLYEDRGLTQPLDLTDFVGTFEIVGVATLVSQTSGLVLGGTFGTVAPFLDNTVTSLFPGGFNTHYYLQLVDPTGLVGFAMRGTIAWVAP